MPKMSRILWMWVLLVFLHGCSGYRSLKIPYGETRAYGQAEEMPIKLNDQLRITQQDGKQISGVVSQIGSAGIEVHPNEGNDSAHWVSYSAMEKLEIFESGHPVRSLGLAAAVVGGIVVGYYIVEDNDAKFYPDASGK